LIGTAQTKRWWVHGEVRGQIGDVVEAFAVDHHVE